MKNLRNAVVKLLATAVVLGTSGAAWSAIISNENPIDPTYSYYNTTHAPRIDMTNINLNYTAGGQTNKGPGNSTGKFVASSSSSTVLTLVNPNLSTTSFSGVFSLNAAITSSGVLKSGTFSFKSSDPMFGFGTDRKGKPISGNVFSGNLTAFGWSDSRGFLEFGIGGFTGWACTTMSWCTNAERLWLNTYSGTLGLPTAIGNVTNWSSTAYGTAVIPIPAAVWLFGSGLLGLVGFAKRKKN
jgi:hypothetical protein